MLLYFLKYSHFYQRVAGSELLANFGYTSHIQKQRHYAAKILVLCQHHAWCSRYSVMLENYAGIIRQTLHCGRHFFWRQKRMWCIWSVQTPGSTCTIKDLGPVPWSSRQLPDSTVAILILTLAIIWFCLEHASNKYFFCFTQSFCFTVKIILQGQGT